MYLALQGELRMLKTADSNDSVAEPQSLRNYESVSKEGKRILAEFGVPFSLLQLLPVEDSTPW